MAAKKLSLNRKFYDISAVKEALQDFRKVCNIRIKEKKESIDVEIEPISGHDASTISGEFLNYVLGIMKNKTIV